MYLPLNQIKTIFLSKICLALAIFHVKAQAIEKPSVGRCYATEYFAVGWFDKRGGELTLPKIENARLTVPENAVSELTMFYFMLVYDACSEIAWPSFCPVMVCGPPGYYQVSILPGFMLEMVDCDDFMASLWLSLTAYLIGTEAFNAYSSNLTRSSVLPIILF